MTIRSCSHHLRTAHVRSIAHRLRQQARWISATAPRLELHGDSRDVPPSDGSNAVCARDSRAARQQRYEEVSQATPNGRLGPGDETTVGKQGFMAGKQGGIHRDHGSCAYRRQKSSRQGRTRRAGWSWEVLEEKKLSRDAEHGVDDDCSRREMSLRGSEVHDVARSCAERVVVGRGER